MSVCGSIVKEFWDVSASGVEAALDPKIFTQTDSISQTELFIEADQMEQVGTYKLRLLVYYADYPYVSDQKEFIVNIANLCTILAPATGLIEQEYFVGSGPAFYDIQTIVENGFQTNNQICGDIEFTA